MSGDIKSFLKSYLKITLKGTLQISSEFTKKAISEYFKLIGESFIVENDRSYSVVKLQIVLGKRFISLQQIRECLAKQIKKRCIRGFNEV